MKKTPLLRLKTIPCFNKRDLASLLPLTVNEKQSELRKLKQCNAWSNWFCGCCHAANQTGFAKPTN